MGLLRNPEGRHGLSELCHRPLLGVLRGGLRVMRCAIDSGKELLESHTHLDFPLNAHVHCTIRSGRVSDVFLLDLFLDRSGLALRGRLYLEAKARTSESRRWRHACNSHTAQTKGLKPGKQRTAALPD